MVLPSHHLARKHKASFQEENSLLPGSMTNKTHSVESDTTRDARGDWRLGAGCGQQVAGDRAGEVEDAGEALAGRRVPGSLRTFLARQAQVLGGVGNTPRLEFPCSGGGSSPKKQTVDSGPSVLEEGGWKGERGGVLVLLG